MRFLASLTFGFVTASVAASLCPARVNSSGPYSIPIQYKSESEQYLEDQNRHNKMIEEEIQRWGEEDLRRLQEQAWGAIAYSPSTGFAGYSVGHSNEADAERSAIRACDKSDCAVAVTFMHACGAVAAGDNNVWYGAWHSNQQRARQSAQADCVNQGGQNCKVVYSDCSR